MQPREDGNYSLEEQHSVLSIPQVKQNTHQIYFGPVAPIHILEHLYLCGYLNYTLLLAHDIVATEQDMNEYARLFQNARINYVILDNSVIELGNSVGLDILHHAARIVSPSTLVIPDVMLKSQETVDAAKRFLDQVESHSSLSDELRSQHWRSFDGYMFVPQGENFWEWCWCAEQMARDERIGWWGIPRNIRKTMGPDFRRKAAEVCEMLNPERKIHLLGFSDDMVDDLLALRKSNARGIDSAVPLRAYENQNYPPYFPLMRSIPPRGNWWETAMWDPHMARAVEEVQSMINA